MSRKDSFALNLFEFGNDDNGNYVNLVEEKREKIENVIVYNYEQLTEKFKENSTYCLVARYYDNGWWQRGLTFDEIIDEIKSVSNSKCYHYGNMERGIYVYSMKFGENDYRIFFENTDHIVSVRHLGQLNDLLFGKEKIMFPACEVDLFNVKTTEKIKSGYGNYKDDIRYKIICGEFEALKYSTNRIDPNKKPKDFYELEFTLNDFIKYYGEDENVSDSN